MISCEDSELYYTSPKEYDIFVLANLQKNKLKSTLFLEQQLLSQFVHLSFTELLVVCHIHSWFRDQPRIWEVHTQNLGLASWALSF